MALCAKVPVQEPQRSAALSRHPAMGGSTHRVGSTGRVEVQSGTLSFVTGAFDNSGVVDALTNNLLIGGGGVSSGTFIVSPGGNIRFTGGRQSLGNGSNLSGGGQYEIAGGQLDADAAVPATNLAFSSGFLGGSGVLTIMQNFAWSGGTMVGAGTTTLAAGSVSIFSGAALKRSLDRAIQLAGAATWIGSGDLALDEATFTIETNGLLEMQTDATVGDSNGTGSTGRPAGTLIRRWHVAKKRQCRNDNYRRHSCAIGRWACRYRRCMPADGSKCIAVH
jgi:hypothetical protein